MGAYSTVVYNKGGYVLHMLRMIFFDSRAPAGKDPEERFIAMMQDFCNTYHNKPASTEDFKAIVEKHMPPTMDLEGNGRADWFFRQYVYGTGMAEYQFSYKVEPTPDGKFNVQGQVVQSGVPAGWRDMLPLYAELQGRTVRMGFLRVREKTTAFQFVLPSKPDKLMLNSNEDTLAEIKQ
jgi:aminopeptidase N